MLAVRYVFDAIDNSWNLPRDRRVESPDDSGLSIAQWADQALDQANPDFGKAAVPL